MSVIDSCSHCELPVMLSIPHAVQVLATLFFEKNVNGRWDILVLGVMHVGVFKKYAAETKFVLVSLKAPVDSLYDAVVELMCMVCKNSHKIVKCRAMCASFA